MAAPLRFPTQGATPVSIAGGRRCQVQTLDVHNPHASDGAYVKLYGSSATAPTGSTVPVWSAWVPALTAKTLAPFADLQNGWIAVATEAGAGLTGPTTAFEISGTLE